QAAAQLPVDLKKTVRDLEIDFVNRAMAAGRFNQRRAAQLLGLTYHQFRGYLKKYDHERHDGPQPHGAPTSDRMP
ncbi:MAG: phage shock protein operon transcriptional activator, partial [Gammaproteobacteria bacterium]|nr:phage shock protein operon transcriptional activator [Gammaproteobacteria bacterium]